MFSMLPRSALLFEMSNRCSSPWPRRLSLGLLVVLAGFGLSCSQPQPPFVDPGLRAQAMPLIETGGQQRVGRLLYRAGFRLEADDPSFGGLSGLEWSLDGSQMLAVSDRGYWLRADLGTSADGVLSTFANVRLGALKDLDGLPLDGQGRWDAEEIVALSPGSYLVTFEHDHRATTYALDEQGLPTLNPEPFSFPPGILEAPPNEGLETATRLADGRLLLIAEGLLDSRGDRIGWISSSDYSSWEQVTFASWQELQPTSATTLSDGRIVLLERSYSPEVGNRIRISEFAASDLEPGARITTRELAFLAAPMTLDNMEAVANSTGPHGETFLYLLSDDNFSHKQRTLLLQFELLPGETANPEPQEAGADS